jgi:hypothetical protein
MPEHIKLYQIRKGRRHILHDQKKVLCCPFDLIHSCRSIQIAVAQWPFEEYSINHPNSLVTLEYKQFQHYTQKPDRFGNNCCQKSSPRAMGSTDLIECITRFEIVIKNNVNAPVLRFALVHCIHQPHLHSKTI